MIALQVATPDGPMELRGFPPAGTARGGVILYMDAFGLRPELDELCRRHAAEGWFALLPDLYHRLPRRRFPVPPDATTPLDPTVLAAMLPWLESQFGNASSRHEYGLSTLIRPASQSRQTLLAPPGSRRMLCHKY